MRNPILSKLFAITAAALAALSIFCAPALARPDDAQQTEPLVNTIEIEGLRRIDRDAVMEHIGQGLYDPIDPSQVSKDIKSIFGMGYFDDISVEVEPFEGGLRLIYKIKEKPSVRRILIFGNDEVEESKINEKITISSGALADPVLIQNNAEAIKKLYEEEGYTLATIVPVLRNMEGGYALLTFFIKEGPKVKIRDISFPGHGKLTEYMIKNEHFMKNRLKTAEWWIMSWIASSGRYERDKLAMDVEGVKNYYYDNGYIQAEVFDPLIKYSDNREWVDIAIKVKEGDKFFIKSISFAGNEVYTEEFLRKKLAAEVGQIVSRKVLTEDVTELTDTYGEKGYAMASIYPDIKPDEKTKMADIVFKVHEGDIYHMGRITVTGNYNTKDKVIRREVKLDEGDLFNSRLLKRSYQRVTNLNYFDDVRFNTTPKAERKLLDLNVDVKEKSTGMLNIGGGYSSADRFMGMIDVTQANLGGRGQYAKFKTEFSSRSTTYELSFTDPWFMDMPLRLDTGIYSTQRELADYEKKSKGFTLGLSKTMQEFWRVGAGYRIEETSIYNIDEYAPAFTKRQEGDSMTSSIMPTIERDSRDNPLLPHTGSLNSMGYTYAGLGGDNKFYKIDTESAWHAPVTKKTTFSIRGRYGYANGHSGKELPVYERYSVGGVYTVRGLRDVGPRDENDHYLGGRQRLVFNTEYTFPLSEESRFYGALFYDLGTAFDRSIKMRYSAGTGFRWISPIGPIKLDWARNIKPKPGESRTKWEFSVGTFF